MLVFTPGSSQAKQIVRVCHNYGSANLVGKQIVLKDQPFVLSWGGDWPKLRDMPHLELRRRAA